MPELRTSGFALAIAAIGLFTLGGTVGALGAMMRRGPVAPAAPPALPKPDPGVPAVNTPTSPGAGALPAGLSFHTARAAGRTMPFAVYVPPGLDRGAPAPTILFLHGRGESGVDGTRQTSVGLLPAVLNQPEKWPFVVVLPQKPDQSRLWDAEADLVFAALEQARGLVAIDPARTYLTGLSQGGFGTWALAAMKPELFAAIAPVCGFGDPAFVGPRISALPVRAFHGVLDDVIDIAKSRALAEAAKAARAGNPDAPEVSLTEYPDLMHNSWDRAYRNEDLGAWFLTHRR